MEARELSSQRRPCWPSPDRSAVRRTAIAAAGPIAGLKVDDFWYDKGGNPLPSDSYRHPRPLQPNEVITVTLETPADPRMNRNQWQFSHANGEIKPVLVAKM